MGTVTTPKDRLLLSIDQFSESTGDYYLLFHCQSGIIHFSQNTREFFDLFPQGESRCTLEQWRSIVTAVDLPKLKKLYEELLRGSRTCYTVNYRVRNRLGQTVWINSRGKCFLDASGRPEYVLGRLSVQSSPDRPDGAYHHAALRQELERLRRAAREGFLLIMGVDNLRSINLKHGREFGDAVVRSLAEGIVDTVGNVEQIFHINGDSFAVVLPGAAADDVVCYFRSIQDKLRGQCTISGGSVPLLDYQVPESSVLIQYAESSLEAAKASGKNRLCFFSPEDYEKKLTALELREDLETAVRRGFAGFSLCYQPQVRSESFDLFGAEALLRFESARRGTVPPGEFIPILEESGLIYQVGLWVLQCALEQCRIWRAQFPSFHISVNMSYMQLYRAEIETDVLRILKASGLPGDALTIEVTESMQLQDYQHLNTIFSAWKQEGIGISVDDFGTGYSSLSWLKELTVDEIKIDRCFVSGVQNSAYNLRLISNMIELADSCHIRVCCEGVETPEELLALERLHPTLYQGSLFATPSVPDSFAHHYRSRKDLLLLSNAGQAAQHGQGTLEDTSYFSPEKTELESALLDATEDILSLCDMQTHEIYYLNQAGQRLYGLRDYRGQKCYKVFRGMDTPCAFCPNEHLRQDSFYVWEDHNDYCGRHFLLKDKLLLFKDKKLRMEVAVDITKREYISQTTRERLEFAQTVAGYVEALARQTDYRHAVDQVLKSVGEFYRADRAYLFEPSPLHPGHWDNTFEWCDHQVLPQREHLQNVPPDALERWMHLFEQQRSILIYNLEPLQKTSPLEWQTLHQQGIQRLIAVPLLDNSQVIGFIGVDNPRRSIHDDSQARVLASFLVTRFRLEKAQQ